MIILGIHDGHNASASLIIDGKLVCALGEERLSRDKHQYGYPAKAIDTVLNASGITIDDVDRIAMSTATLPPAYFYTSRNSTLTIADYWKEQKEYWYPKLYKNEDPKYLDIFADKVDKNNFPYDESLIKHERDHEGMWKARLDHICKTLDVDEEIVSVHDHHKSHAYYAYITDPNRDEPILVYTMDGGGDNANGTVSIGEPGKPLQEISRSSNCNIGRMYRYATLLLGMRPADHEYKLMGLAPYGEPKYFHKILDNLVDVKEDGSFRLNLKYFDLYFQKYNDQHLDIIFYLFL